MSVWSPKADPQLNMSIAPIGAGQTTEPDGAAAIEDHFVSPAFGKIDALRRFLEDGR